jgi:large subunit ribosomal protein L24
VKRHRRQTVQGTQAGIIEQEAPIHVSNVKLVCPACQKPVRVGFRVRSDGVKVRVCKSCRQDID